MSSSHLQPVDPFQDCSYLHLSKERWQECLFFSLNAHKYFEKECFFILKKYGKILLSGICGNTKTVGWMKFSIILFLKKVNEK